MKFTKSEVSAINTAVKTFIDGYVSLFGELEAKERLADFYAVKSKIQKRIRKRMLNALVEIEIENEQIKQQAQQLGGGGIMRGKTWTNEEKQQLMALFPSGSKKELLALFPDRTWDQIRVRANAWGVHREVKIVSARGVCKDCGEETRLITSSIFRGLCKTCYNRAFRGRRGVQKRCDFWNDEELELVRQMFPRGQLAELQRRLPHRSLSAIKHQAHVLGLRQQPGGMPCANIGEVKSEVVFEPMDRDIQAMMQAASQKPVKKILPEIADLLKAERRILQQLQHEGKEKSRYVERRVSGRQAV